jgi:hypothetical protein
MTSIAAALSGVALAGCGAGMGVRQTADLGPAPAAGTGLASGQCFRTQDIRNHTIVGDRTLLLNVRGKDYYRVTMVGSCLAGAIPSDPIITRQPPGSPIVCKPIDLDIGIGRDGFETRCIVESIVPMTPAEVAALPPRLKP